MLANISAAGCGPAAAGREDAANIAAVLRPLPARGLPASRQPAKPVENSSAAAGPGPPETGG